MFSGYATYKTLCVVQQILLQKPFESSSNYVFVMGDINFVVVLIVL